MNSPHRPRRNLIWVGLGMMVGAVIIVVIMIFIARQSIGREDEIVEADGQPHEVSLPADKKYGVFIDEDSPATCKLVAGDGAEIDQGPVEGTYEINQWTAKRSFNTGGGDITATCTAKEAGADTEIRLGPLPSVGGLLGLIVGAVCLSLVLGLGGLIVLIIALVRRSRPTHPGY